MGEMPIVGGKKKSRYSTKSLIFKQQYQQQLCSNYVLSMIPFWFGSMCIYCIVFYSCMVSVENGYVNLSETSPINAVIKRLCW